METIKNAFKDLPRWAWYLIGAGAALMIFLGIKHQRSIPTAAQTNLPAEQPGTVAPAPQGASEADVSSMIDTKLAAFGKQYDAELAQGFGIVSEAMQKTQAATNQTIAANQESLGKTISDLSGQIRQVNEDTRNQLEAVTRFAQAATTPRPAAPVAITLPASIPHTETDHMAGGEAHVTEQAPAPHDNALPPGIGGGYNPYVQ